MTSRIRDLAASTPEMLDAFGDQALVRAALAFERELAAAQAAEGLLTADQAQAIAAACQALPDLEALAQSAAHAGTLAIPLVAELRRRLAKHPEAAAKVHLGATSQDVADTVLMLQAEAGLGLIVRDGVRLTTALAALAQTHAGAPMLGRTLLQPARPITFGLKVAGWLLGVDAALRRLSREAEAALLLQFGGASGTLDGLDGKAFAVSQRLAEGLGLAGPPAPWHARRGGVAGLAGALAILTGALGKMAGDVALLAQAEVGEAFEPRIDGRGGSSAMAYKRNPTGCQVARSAALRAPHLAATILSALPQEHERGLGGWQAEGAVLADLFCVAHGALVAMAEVAEGLEVHPDRMAANLAAAAVGDDVGEAAALVASALQAWRRP
ncbi:3-carboxy-cis,cis-muconate cycloisomerase [Phenylobacterium sp. LjRoot225]|uniref:3-carboxy-cis,cis-muconate cycloisomerase n=1 Tax=Phenylobacterium sp. LjRoot225 TaxID=3342285 RepID=UPI003ED043C0